MTVTSVLERYYAERDGGDVRACNLEAAADGTGDRVAAIAWRLDVGVALARLDDEARLAVDARMAAWATWRYWSNRARSVGYASRHRSARTHTGLRAGSPVLARLRQALDQARHNRDAARRAFDNVNRRAAWRRALAELATHLKARGIAV